MMGAWAARPAGRLPATKAPQVQGLYTKRALIDALMVDVTIA